MTASLLVWLAMLAVVAGDDTCLYTKDGLCAVKDVTPGPGCCCAFDAFKQKIDMQKMKSPKTWYEVLRSEKGSDGGRCQTVNVRKDSDTTLTLTLSAYFPWSNDEPTSDKIQATLQYNEKTYIFSYTSARIESGAKSCLVSLQIDPDYENFWITASDSNIEGTPYISVLSTKPQITEEEVRSVTKLLFQIPALREMKYYKNTHGGCPEQPDDQGCPSSEVNAKTDLDLDRFVGAWYILYSSNPGYVRNACPAHIFRGTSDSLAFFERHYRYGLSSDFEVCFDERKYFTYGGQATLDKGIKLCATQSPFGEGKPQCKNYWVLDTDYIRYSVVKTCSTLKYNIAVENIMILSRDYWLSDEEWHNARQAALKAGFNPTPLTSISFHDCPRDSCPLHWATESHFSAYQYAGQWTETLAYSIPKVSPSSNFCSVSRYTAAFNNSIFLQREVYDQATKSGKKTITAEYRPMSLLNHDGRYTRLTSNHGKDDPEPGSFHFILGTDYDRWALVMRCGPGEELGDPVSLKVSVLVRYGVSTQVEEAEALLLASDKYKLISTSFQPVDYKCEFPTCFHTSQAMQEFDADKYAGAWYTLEETPVRSATGLCSMQNIEKSHDNSFTITLSQFNLSSNGFESMDLALKLSNSKVGNFVEDGKEHEEKKQYSVLYTDYDNVALAYLCSTSEEQVFALGRYPGVQRAERAVLLDAIVNNYLDENLLNDNVQNPQTCGANQTSNSTVTAPQYSMLALVLMAQIAVTRLNFKVECSFIPNL